MSDIINILSQLKSFFVMIAEQIWILYNFEHPLFSVIAWIVTGFSVLNWIKKSLQ